MTVGLFGVSFFLTIVNNEHNDSVQNAHPENVVLIFSELSSLELGTLPGSNLKLRCIAVHTEQLTFLTDILFTASEIDRNVGHLLQFKRYFGALESSKTSIPYGQSGHASTPNDSIDCGHVG
ncbi:unnamed protein product [Schistosoma mattheei]|uniref:Uncharacterized protein n=1 Tax=Schistosoma mattheei TaxID=31246 RepID=A0A3P8DME7_9TREM|nr:unnamed protein product [Schistosoma mattheei]